MFRFPARQLRSHSTAFSLIELLVVITVLGIIYMTLLFTSQTQVHKGRDSRRKIDMDIIRKALEEYYDTKNCYPAALPACNNAFTVGSVTLLKSIPCDPRTKTSYVYVPDGNACSSWFQIYSKLEYIQDPVVDILGCRNFGCGPSCQYNYGVTSTNKPLDVCSS